MDHFIAINGQENDVIFIPIRQIKQITYKPAGKGAEKNPPTLYIETLHGMGYNLGVEDAVHTYNALIGVSKGVRLKSDRA